MVNKCFLVMNNTLGICQLSLYLKQKLVACCIVFKFAGAPSGHKMKWLGNTMHKVQILQHMALETSNKNGKYCSLSLSTYYRKGFMTSINHQIQIMKHFLKAIFELRREKKNEQLMKEKTGVSVLVYVHKLSVRQQNIHIHQLLIEQLSTQLFS